jgi:hypothetical protein
MSQESPQFDQLPEALVERLKASERAVGMLTPAQDREILEAAREQFAARPARPEIRRRWHIPAAAAAAVALVALFVARPFDQAGVEVTRLADDIDGSGQVDILDAFALARSRAADADSVSQGRIDELTDRIVSLSLAPTGSVL